MPQPLRCAVPYLVVWRVASTGDLSGFSALNIRHCQLIVTNQWNSWTCLTYSLREERHFDTNCTEYKTLSVDSNKPMKLLNMSHKQQLPAKSAFLSDSRNDFAIASKKFQLQVSTPCIYGTLFTLVRIDLHHACDRWIILQRKKNHLTN